jgi:hypothetical protein
MDDEEEGAAKRTIFCYMEDLHAVMSPSRIVSQAIDEDCKYKRKRGRPDYVGLEEEPPVDAPAGVDSGS